MKAHPTRHGCRGLPAATSEPSRARAMPFKTARQVLGSTRFSNIRASTSSAEPRRSEHRTTTHYNAPESRGSSTRDTPTFRRTCYGPCSMHARRGGFTSSGLSPDSVAALGRAWGWSKVGSGRGMPWGSYRGTTPMMMPAWRGRDAETVPALRAGTCSLQQPATKHEAHEIQGGVDSRMGMEVHPLRGY